MNLATTLHWNKRLSETLQQNIRLRFIPVLVAYSQGRSGLPCEFDADL